MKLQGIEKKDLQIHLKFKPSLMFDVQVFNGCNLQRQPKKRRFIKKNRKRGNKLLHVEAVNSNLLKEQNGQELAVT